MKRAFVVGILGYLLGCRKDIGPSLKVEAKLETEDGLLFIPVGPHGGASLSGSLYLAAAVTNTHPDLAATDVQIQLDLYRKKEDSQPERWYRYYALDELKRIPPGQTVRFRQYVKQTMSGYERCEVKILKARGKR